jgi:hypothetical protein
MKAFAVGLLLGLSLLVLSAGRVPATARADGDPASDILLFADYSIPYSQPVSVAEKARLDEVTKKARRAHYPIKVALIASGLDLGSDSRFTGHPSAYARFLSRELTSPRAYGRHRTQAADVREPILVVMPDGVALARRGMALSTTAIEKLPRRPGPQGDALTEKAVVAVQRLAARAGHPLEGIGPAPPPATAADSSPTSSPDGGSISGWEVAALVALGGLAIAGGVAFTRVRRRRAERS